MSEGDKKTTSGDTGGDRLAVAALGLAAASLVAIPALLGGGLYFATRSVLGRREYASVGALTLAAIIWKATWVAPAYVMWLVNLVQGKTTLGDVPWLPLLLIATLLACVLGLVVGSGRFTKFGRVLGGHRAGIKRHKAGTNEDVLPDREKRAKAVANSKIANAPGGLLVAQQAHSATNPTTPGQRLFPLGVGLNGAAVMLGEDEIRTHGFIIGTTGSGKSETIKVLAGALLDLGWSGMLLDLKEDTASGGLADWCRQYSAYHSTMYQELCLSDEDSKTWFNPLAGMGPDEMRDTILALQEFEAAYYEALNKELLGQLITLCTWAHEIDPAQFAAPTMYGIAKICSSPSLEAATKRMRAVVTMTIPTAGEEDFRALSKPSKAQQEAAVGFGSRLGQLYDTAAGRVVLRPGSGRTELDVASAGLTYIGLDSLGKKDMTRMVSSALLQRMAVYASQRVTGKAEASQPRFLIVDEAARLNRDMAKNLLSRARGAGISVWLCTQGPNDWVDREGDDWSQMTNNVNVAVIMRQGDADSAEKAAEFLGQEFRQEVSEKVTQELGILGPRRVRGPDGRHLEQVSISHKRDYRVQPDAIRDLTVGEAIVKVGSPKSRLEYLRVIRRDARDMPL